jgi:hypothetical protein
MSAGEVRPVIHRSTKQRQLLTLSYLSCGSLAEAIVGQANRFAPIPLQVPPVMSIALWSFHF